MSGIIVRVNNETHKGLKLYCLENDTTIQETLSQYISSLVEKKESTKQRRRA